MPTAIEGPALIVEDVSSDGHDVLHESRRLSRSPHPYHLHHPGRSIEHLEKNDGCKSASTFAMPPIDDSQASASIASSSFFDADSRKRRKESISPSESGTEADDESGPFLKGLPAPPTRLRKGLKQEASLGTPSPLLTPSYLDDEKRRQGLEAQFRRRTSLQSYASTDEETLKIREKFQKRRRAELLRRTTETLLFMGIGCLACWNVLLLPVKRGTSYRQHHSMGSSVDHLMIFPRAGRFCIGGLRDLLAVPVPSLLPSSYTAQEWKSISTIPSNSSGIRPSNTSLSRTPTFIRFVVPAVREPSLRNRQHCPWGHCYATHDCSIPGHFVRTHLGTVSLVCASCSVQGQSGRQSGYSTTTSSCGSRDPLNPLPSASGSPA